MSSRRETLQVARLAPNHLGDAAAKVETYLRSQLHPKGGGLDRSGEPDLYYTVFALEGLLALRAELPVETTRAYLLQFGNGEQLDLVHRACLARCWADLPGEPLASTARQAIADGIHACRSRDGGFHAQPDAEHGTVYHAFLAHGAYQDLGLPCPDPARLADSIATLTTGDGAFANTQGLPLGTTTVSAAALTLLRHLDRPLPEGLGAWFLAQAHRAGGFRANPQTPMPDLLSTATALHALSSLHIDLAPLREPCLDFIDSLWTGEAFCGHWADDAHDCEYTYYALLALGHLSL